MVRTAALSQVPAGPQAHQALHRKLLEQIEEDTDR